MSKSVASESNGGQKIREMIRKRGAGDEGDEDEEGFVELPPAESLTISTTSQFLFMDDFKRLLVGFVQGDTLMTLRLAMRAWKRVADAFIDKGVRSGAIIVHDGKDISWEEVRPRLERRKLVTRMVLLLNITKVGMNACFSASKLVVVDITKGIESIGEYAFGSCCSLTTVYFPTTLTSISHGSFGHCSNLDNVNLLHPNLQELCHYAFYKCSELKSMTIPDSLQTFGNDVFHRCSKLVTS